MNKNKCLTNQQFLEELAKRLPNFTDDEFMILFKLLHEHQQEFWRIAQVTNPEIHNLMQEKIQQFEQEKTDKEIEELKKSLAKK